MADEIVVAVDSRVDPTALGPLVDVAETVVRFEFQDPPERARPWLVGLCRNPIVFMIDGDEVPSHALISALPALASDSSIAQWRLARRWCFPNERYWLAERPWWPDLQRRLFARGPLLDFDIQVHGGVREAFPNRLVPEPMYHLACVMRSFPDRRARVREYENQRPGLRAVGGGLLNDTLYVPEHFATLRPEPTPTEDVELLRNVLEAADASSRAIPHLPIIGAEEIAAQLPKDPLDVQGYRASVRIAEFDLRTEPGNDTYIQVELFNLGGAPLPREDRAGVQVRVVTRVLDRRTGSDACDWARTPLPCDIPEGEARHVEALVRVPAHPGVYTIEVDLLNERARWFGCVARADLVVATRWGRYAF